MLVLLPTRRDAPPRRIKAAYVALRRTAVSSSLSLENFGFLHPTPLLPSKSSETFVTILGAEHLFWQSRL